MRQEPDRRTFLTAAGIVLIAGPAGAHQPEPKKDKAAPGSAEDEVTPGEDLMQEHGVLKRVLLVYQEGIRRLEMNGDLPPEAIAKAAKLVREFVEDYHEKQEEDFLFPRFRKANQQVELVETLEQQHQAGRRLTDTTARLATLDAFKDPVERRQLIESMKAFIRMYEPHEAREDTVLFPAFRKLVSANEYDALGEDFEKREHEKFGEDGFEKSVETVGEIEKSLGIYDLTQFTPKT
jgi:hemerythrin-like domain-containing protein